MTRAPAPEAPGIEPLRIAEPPPLRHDPVVRTWVVASGLSSVGDAAWVVALAWTAVHTLPTTVAGVVVALETLPQALLMVAGGLIADRCDTRRVLLLGQLCRVVALMVAAAAWAAGAPTLPVLAAIAVALGCATGLTAPSVATMGRQLVAAEDLGPLSGLVQVSSRVARLLGAPLGGALVAAAGIVPAMLLDAASFLVVWAALLVVIRPRFVLPRNHLPWRAALGDGLAYLWASRPARTLVVGLAGLNVFISPVVAIGVALRVSQSGWTAAWVGYAEACFATGAILGSLAGIRFRPRHSASAGFTVLVVQGAATAVVGADARSAVLGGMLVLGVTAGSASVWLSGVYQRTISPAHLGRVSSLSRLGDLALIPVATPVFAALAAATSVLTATAAFGATMALLCGWFALSPVVRDLR